jgi:hypothetical protein
MAERRFLERLQVAQNPLRTILNHTELNQSRAYFNQLNQLLITHLDQVNGSALTGTIPQNRYTSGKDHNVHYTAIDTTLPYNSRE